MFVFSDAFLFLSTRCFPRSLLDTQYHMLALLGFRKITYLKVGGYLCAFTRREVHLTVLYWINDSMLAFTYACISVLFIVLITEFITQSCAQP